MKEGFSACSNNATGLLMIGYESIITVLVSCNSFFYGKLAEIISELPQNPYQMEIYGHPIFKPE